MRGVIVLLIVCVVVNVVWGTSVCENVYPHLSFGVGYDSSAKCLAAGGCWDNGKSGCSFPKINGYEYSAISHKPGSNSVRGNLTLNAPSGALGPDYKTLDIAIDYESADRLHIKITPGKQELGSKARWEVPESVLPRPNSQFRGASSLSHIIKRQPFELFVRRGDTTIFELSKMLIFQEQYMQVVLGIPKGTRNTFGFGESTRSKQALQIDSTYTLWATDIGAMNFEKSLYGSHPFFMQVMEDGTAHGVFLLNSNAMEASLHSDATLGDALGLQMTGGVLDFYIFAGPTPTAVLQQYFEVIGKPALVPYWSLGFHNCRWGYPSVDYVMEVVANYSAAGIPLETQWVDIDYMDAYKDFTVDPVDFPREKMTAFVNQLHANNQHFVPIVDPGIFAGSFDGTVPTDYPALTLGLEQDVFIKDMTGGNYLGQVWPGATYYPDWFAANISNYWTKQHVDFHSLLQYDGIWIDMNEVSNFCSNSGVSQTCEFDPHSTCPDGCCLKCKVIDTSNKYDFPPYTPHVAQNSLSAKTIAMSSVHAGNVMEFDAHSLYGLMESKETRKAVIEATGGKRPFILSRSTFPSSGVHTAHWTGDNAATWEDLSASIITMNNLAMFGLSMTGADICGFAKNTNEELCARWIEVGAFSPFSRDHSELDATPQELYLWSSVTEASKRALNLRYSLLPHLYTLLYRASSEGVTVMNAMWVNFPADANAFDKDGQYMWGDSILFTPVLTQGATEVTGYFPEGLWYPIFHADGADSRVIRAGTDGATVSLSTPLLVTNVHVRGGRIIPRQQSAMTVAASSVSPFTLFVALDQNKQAEGALYRDDLGADVSSTTFAMAQFTATATGTLTTKLSAGSSATAAKTYGSLGSIEVVGWFGQLNTSVQCSAKLTVGNQVVAVPTSYDAAVDKITVDLSGQAVTPFEFELQWSC